jgi:site-specific DNA-methyltransferase (adenine-specific)
LIPNEPSTIDSIFWAGILCRFAPLGYYFHRNTNFYGSKKMKTKRATIGNATLYCGDCFDILPKLDVQADAIISDMPYGVTNCRWDKRIPLDTFWATVEPLIKLSANVVLFSAGKFTVDLICSKRKWYRYDLIWQKSKKVGFLWANNMPMRNHESIHIFNRRGFFKKATYNPQKTVGGKVYSKIISRRSNIYRQDKRYLHESDGTLHPCSVLSFASERGQHPTQKPIALMEHLVKSYTNENDIVIDMFMGSGSTGVATVNTNRKFIGIERDEKFFDIAVERIKKAYAEYQTKRN